MWHGGGLVRVVANGQLQEFAVNRDRERGF